MFSGSNNYSLSDIAAVTGANDGFGGNNGVWWLIVLIVLFGGWGFGGRGFGGYGGGYGTSETSSVYEGYVLNNDMSMLQRAISDSTNMLERRTDNIINGICTLGYDSLAQTNTINTNVMQGVNTLQGAVKDCCCQTQQNLADVKYTIGATGSELNYNIATQANGITNAISSGLCQTNFNNQTNTRDIIDTQRADTQAILSKLDAMETNRLREKLEAERDAKYALQGQLDRAELRTAIVNDVRPCPQPCYVTCNPWGCNCNCNSGCGC